MENNFNNTVIKVLTKQHGAEVIKWRQSVGVDTRNIEGSIIGYSYGIIDYKFNLVSYIFAKNSNLKIIELPKIGEKRIKTEENMENLIGRKCKGFDNGTITKHWIGKIGEITRVSDDDFIINFDDGNYWYYPLSEVHKHLIPLKDEIPTLGEGKLMLVSDIKGYWEEYTVVAKTENGKFLCKSQITEDKFIVWNFAKEIKLEEIVEDVLIHLTMKDISEGKGVGVNPSLIRIKE